MSPKPKASVRLLKARRAAAKELNLPADHWAVKRTALLSVAHENLEQALVEGHRVDISDLLKVEDALNAVKAALPKEGIKVEIAFVDGATGNRSTDIKELYPPEAEPAPKQIEAEAVETKPADKPIDIKPEAKAEAPAPAPAPAPALPERNPSMRQWEIAHGRVYGRSSRDGGPILGSPAFDPDSKYNRGYNNDLPVCFVASNGQHRDLVAPDPHPYRSPTGGDRSGHPLPVPVVTKGNGQ